MKKNKFLTELESNDNFKVCTYDNENDVVLYTPHCIESLKINREIFSILKNFKSDNMINISEIIYAENRYNGSKICGYIKKHYEKDNTSILEKNSNYLISNMQNTYKLFSELAENHILVNGFDTKKVIIDKEHIVLPYPEQCTYSIKSIEEIKKINFDNLLRIYKLLLFRDIDIKTFDKYLELFNCESNYLIENFTKKLGEYNKPKEYLKK